MSKTLYYLLTSEWNEQANRYVDTRHKDELFDLSDKKSVKQFAIACANYVAAGLTVRLRQYVEVKRQAIDISKSLKL